MDSNTSLLTHVLVREPMIGVATEKSGSELAIIVWTYREMWVRSDEMLPVKMVEFLTPFFL